MFNVEIDLDFNMKKVRSHEMKNVKWTSFRYLYMIL